MGLIVQFLSSALTCSICACMGMMFAWPSSTHRLFKSKETILHRPMTERELDLFGSLFSVGALVGIPILGLLLDRLGRKNSSIIASAAGVLSWTMIAFSNRVEVVLTAVFVAGFSGASFLTVTVYISEFCQDSIRGAMISGTMVFFCFGMLVSYLLGGVVSYNVMIYVCLSLCATVTAALMMLKESPTYLMMKGLKGEAARSIAFYRSMASDSKEVLRELDVIRRILNPVMDETTPEEESLNNLEAAVAQPKKKLSLFKFIRKSRSTRSALYLSMTMVTASVFQGLAVLQVYAKPLFEDAIPSMSPTVSSVLLAVICVLSGFVAAYLTESAGRRPLMIYSTFAAGATCLLLGLQLHLKWGPNWLIAVNVYFFATMFSFGGGTVPYVLIGEVFLPEVKSYITMLVMEWIWICNSIILFIFNPILKAIGLGPVFYIFAGVSMATGVYSVIMLPETKGLAVDEIQDRLLKRKIKLFT